MTQTLHHLIEQYGLLAIFIGCIAEGETAAILGGFFAHQQLFAIWQTVVAAFLGATLGDTLLFLVGQRFAASRCVQRLRTQAGFERAMRLVREHPNLFVLSNRYIYGMRTIGGVAAGLSGISVRRFIALNATSALLWAMLFSGVGYVFGLGAEQLIGRTLHRHDRLLVALGLLLAAVATASLLVHRRARRMRACGPASGAPGASQNEAASKH